LELDRAFDFDIAREDCFASVVCPRIRFWIRIIDYGWFWWLPLRDSQDDYSHLEPDSAVLLESAAPAFAGTNLLSIW